MKKHLFILLTLLVSTMSPIKAYEYFTIYFTDGTKSEAFYATDVDSIEYSKIDLDGIEHADWQVQEIYTCDSSYRYPLAQIDRIDFKDVDADVVANDIANISINMNTIFQKCHSSQELYQYKNFIMCLEGVEDVWADCQSVFIKVKDWGVLTYPYPPHRTVFNGNPKQTSLIQKHTPRITPNIEGASHKHLSAEKVGIVFQMSRDADFTWAAERADTICKRCTKFGIDATIISSPLPSFFCKSIFNYDIIILMTHGIYDEKNDRHWLATGEQIYITSLKNPANKDSLFNVAKKFINEKYYVNGYSPNEIGFNPVIENRNGDSIEVCYTWISNNYISRYRPQNAGKTIIFNTACQSMKKNAALADAFGGSDLAYYWGYSEVDEVGPDASLYFMDGLLSGYSTFSAYGWIPEDLRIDRFEYPKGSGNNLVTELLPWMWEVEKPALCVTYPETDDFIEDAEGNYVLKGHMKRFLHVDELPIYIQISKQADMENFEDLNPTTKYDDKTFLVDFGVILNKEKLEPNTTYFYRAYMNDGFSNCYGEIKSFYTGDAEAYCVLNDSTLTFYYDGKRNEHEGEVNVLLYDRDIEFYHPYDHNKVKKVIFDPSFANYHPISAYCMFHGCKNMISIENIEYLNTSDVINMYEMFGGCSSITSIDLSHFDTSNVLIMDYMFSGCSSLSNINVSQFDTKNVTRMFGMFCGCSSLTNIDISTFDTSEVLVFDQMFSGCQSLTSINISHLNTSNLCSLGGMFQCCYSLQQVNMNGLSFEGDLDISSMFNECSSLNVVEMRDFSVGGRVKAKNLFNGCNSLTSFVFEDKSNKSTLEMREMFGKVNSLNNIQLQLSAKKIIFDYMFDDKNFEDSDVNLSGLSFDIHADSVQIVRMFYGFYYDNAARLQNLILSDWNFYVEANYADVCWFFDSFKVTVLDFSRCVFDFSNCSSCLSGYFIHHSNVNTIYVNDFVLNGLYKTGNEMFFLECENLTGGQGTKIGQNLYGYDSNGIPLYYYCGKEAKYAHIDGGKDNPGLFTAK